MDSVVLKIKQALLKLSLLTNPKQIHKKEEYENPREDLYHLPKEKRENQEFMLSLITEDQTNAYFICPELRDNEEFMLKVIQLGHSNIYYASSRLKSLDSFLFQAIEINKNIVYWNFVERKRDDEEFMFRLIMKNVCTLSQTSSRIRMLKDFRIKLIENIRCNEELNHILVQSIFDFPKDFDIMLLVVKKDGILLKYMESEIKNDKKIALEAVKQNKEAYKYIGYSLLHDFDILGALNNFIPKLKYTNSSLLRFSDVILVISDQ